MNILVRVPNWLGDLVMSSAFLSACARRYPGSCIDVIAKKEHSPLMSLFGGVGRVYALERRDAGSFLRLAKFHQAIGRQQRYDLFFCLPGSFSSALGGWLTRSRLRVGYQGDLRSGLLTHAYPKPSSGHRVQEYWGLLQSYAGNGPLQAPCVHLQGSRLNSVPTVLSHTSLPRPWILFNPNSEAQSRRIPLQKAAAIADKILQAMEGTLVFPGAPGDVAFIGELCCRIRQKERCLNAAGTTDCLQLAALCHSADLVVSADSGIVHLASALSRPVVVLFGAGNPAHTAPFESSNAQVLRAAGVSCAPCVSNRCAQAHPPCIMHIEDDSVLRACEELLGRR